MAGKKVFVGLSGGVDSSVSAHMLKAQGYEVVGVFIKTWQPDFLVCNWERERIDAMRVAAHLDIPFLTCDAEEAYKVAVGEYMIREYLAGNTPNPDVMCNRHVKFGVFWDFAKSHGADYIATGHYAQVVEVSSRVFELRRGVDDNKDQSYFLWTLTQEDLAHTLFPVGKMTKPEVRAYAAEHGIPVAEKKDSQGICFLGHVDIESFLSHYTKLVGGAVLDTAGRHVGTHRGALVYTLGQRHGFTVDIPTTNGVPYYVVAKDVDANTITVAHEPPRVVRDERIVLEHVSWTNTALRHADTCLAQFRYRQMPFTVRCNATDDGTCELKVPEEVDRPARGQSCVLYTNEGVCIGGGVVK